MTGVRRVWGRWELAEESRVRSGWCYVWVGLRSCLLG